MAGEEGGVMWDVSAAILLLILLLLAVAGPVIVQIGANQGSFGCAWPKHGFWNW